MIDTLSASTENTGAHEARVRQYYHESGGPAYWELMDNFWHHGPYALHLAGASPIEAAQRQEEFLIDQAEVSAGDLVLDFGSGPGGATIHMAKHKGLRMVGVSNDEGLSAHARNLAAQENVTDQVSFVTIGDLDYLHMPWPDGSFDAVTFYESPCHLTRKSQFFQEMYRMVKPGGRMVGMDWIQRPSPILPSQTPEEMQALVDPVCEHICLASLETVDSYTQWMRDAGFTVELAEDMYPGVACWGSTPDADRERWETHPDLRIRAGKRALDDLRRSGNFSVAQWVVVKPAA